MKKLAILVVSVLAAASLAAAPQKKAAPGHHPAVDQMVAAVSDSPQGPLLCKARRALVTDCVRWPSTAWFSLGSVLLPN